MAAGEYPQPPIAEQFDFRIAEVECGRVINCCAEKADC
jgi:hypothetical protein